MSRALLIVSLAATLAACGGSSDKGIVIDPIDIAPLDPRFSDLRATALRELDNNEAGAMSIAIYHQGEIVFAEGYGEKVVGKGNPVNKNTLFQLGSTTKMFTALATLRLVEQGVIDLQDPLMNALPGLNYHDSQQTDWQNITLQHLMTHQGGFLDDYIGMKDNDELVDYMRTIYPLQNPQMNPPGLFYNYSNPNWSYLGAVVEYHSQTAYSQWMKEQVFEPLGMTRSTFSRDQAAADGNFALGIELQDNGTLLPLDNIDQLESVAPVLPAGAQTWSTPTEALKMAEFLLKGDPQVLSNALRTQMTQQQVHQEVAGLPMHYGYGIFVADGFEHNDRWYPVKVWEHGGNTAAYTSLFWILPDHELAISIMSSGQGNDFRNTLMAAIETLVDLPSPQAMPVAPVDVDSFDNHVGTYQAPPLTLNVSREGNQLMIEVPQLDADGTPYNNQLFAVGGNSFVAEADGNEFLFTFFPLPQGEQSIYMRNRQLVGIREGFGTSTSTSARSGNPLTPKLKVLN